MKIYFKGYYGYNNIGDDIFVHIAKWYCQNINQSMKPLFIGKDLPYTIEYKNVNNKYKRNLIEIIYMFKADYVIYWGGSTIESIEGYTNLKYWIDKFKFLQKKFIAFGVSLGPFINEKNKSNTLNFLSKSKYIGVRDNKSLEYDNKFKFTFDLAILAPIIFPYEKKQSNLEKWKIGINFNKSKNTKEYYKFLKNLCIKEKNNINEVKIFIFNKHEEKENHFSECFKIDMLDKGINARIYYYSNNTDNYLREFVDIDFLFGTRLHSGILAYSYNIKFVLDEYHEKCTSFVETINNPIRYKDLNENFKLKQINDFNYDNQIETEYFKRKILNELENLTEIIKK